MKSFKIAGFYIKEQKMWKEIELSDGIIINREDDQRSWLIELFMGPSFFEQIKQAGNEFEAQTVISHSGNDPALFSVQLRNSIQLEKGISVLLEGRLMQMRNEFAKQVLAELVKEGFEGQQLIEKFNDHIKKRRNVPNK